jgi:hypothetical protein
MLVQWKSIIQNITMYTTNLNAAIAGTDMEGKTIENILINLDMKTCLTMAVFLQSQLILDSYDSKRWRTTN